MTAPSTGLRARAPVILVFLAALLLSGVAGIINQVVWQRALKIYLAGSEAISSMIVVFVFMLGLGLGSFAMGFRAHRLRNPLRAFALVELSLALINGGICYLLALDVADSVYAFQRVVISVGVPLRLLYALTATVLLIVPCFLMGMTMPLASEGSQRQLACRDNRFLSVLFFLNTFGAVLGAAVSGFLILPVLGQKRGLMIAVALNGLAGMLSLVLSLRMAAGGASDAPAAPASPGRGAPPACPRRLRPEIVLGFFLGFISLAYEMYLFRIAALTCEPLPHIFSAVLALFLLTWSAGVYWAKWLKERIPLYLALAGIAVVAVPMLYRFARWGLHDVRPGSWWREFWLGLCFVPCVLFGILFTQVVTRFARSWGNDVGRYFAANTFGSCLGVLAGTLIGFEFAPEWTPWTLAVGEFALLVYLRRAWRAEEDWRRKRRGLALAAAALVALVCGQLAYWHSRGGHLESRAIVARYYGKGGVIEVFDDGGLVWDGLWHAFLRDEDNYIGTPMWKLAVVPLLCHAQPDDLEACVVGVGSGVTTATLAQSSRVAHVDAYEINERIADVLRDYPHGTMNVADNPKITILWQDGRCGLALRGKKYDLISQQPLYLKQAGSSVLLSREYMELVRDQLKPGGVFCIYCNSLGNDAQARIVRRTAAEVFRYCESFGNGYLLIVSDSPLEYRRETIEARLAGEPDLGPICREHGIDRLLEFLDRPRLRWDCPYQVTDDRPIVEHPGIASYLVERAER